MKLLKIPTIMVTEKFVWPFDSKLKVESVAGASVVVAGVAVYSYYKITGKKKAEAEKESSGADEEMKKQDDK